MKPIILCMLSLSPIYAFAQTTIDNDIMNCIIEVYKNEGVNITQTLDNFEKFLIEEKLLKDNSGESYLSIYKKISIENKVNISADDFDDEGLLEKSPGDFLNCYQTRIPEILKSESPLKKLYTYFQNNSIEMSPGNVSKKILELLQPADFKNDVVRYYSLFTFLKTSIIPSITVAASVDDKKYSLKKNFEKKLLIQLSKKSKLSVGSNSIDFSSLPKRIESFLIPSADTLKTIVFQSAKETPYSDFVKTLDLIQTHFNKSRDNISKIHFGKNFKELSGDQKREVIKLLPQRIKVEEPI